MKGSVRKSIVCSSNLNSNSNGSLRTSSSRLTCRIGKERSRTGGSGTANSMRKIQKIEMLPELTKN